jgi:CheY-like chemotaxis protein
LAVDIRHLVRLRWKAFRASMEESRYAAPAEQSTRVDNEVRAERPRILVVEDDGSAREVLALLLRYYGYEVAVASNGADAMSLVTDVSPDLVVMDWLMPGLSGVALCLAIRERRQTLPIIVVSSAEEVFEREQPVNARLRKPVDPPLLHRVIGDELARAGT